MSRKKNEKEVSIKLPRILRIEEPEIVKDTIESERLRVFAVTKRIGECISGLMMAVSLIMLFVSLQYFFYPLFSVSGFPLIKGLLTPELIIAAAGITGLINIICGFVMMAKE